MKKTHACFCFAAVLTMSRVSGSGFTPYFFIMIGSENSLTGIKAAQWQLNKQIKIHKQQGKHCIRYLDRKRAASTA